MPHLKGVTITSGLNAEYNAVGWSLSKTVLVSTVQAKFHSGDLKIAKDLKEAAVLLRELQDFLVNFTSAGNATFGAQGAHDDLVLALSMAAFGVDHQRRVRAVPMVG